MILLFLLDFESLTLDDTDLNICFDFISLIDLLKSISLNGSPSSTIRAFLITFSSVMKFPKILTLST